MNAELTKERDLMHGKRVMILSVRYVSKSTLKEWEFEVMYDGITRKVRGFIETYRLFSYAGYPISDSPTIRHFTPALAGIVEIDEVRNALRIKEIHHSGKVYKEEDAPVRGGKRNVPATPSVQVELPAMPDNLDAKIAQVNELLESIYAELSSKDTSSYKSFLAAQTLYHARMLKGKSDA